MSAATTLSTPTAAPTRAEADRLTPSDLVLLIIVRLLIAWAQGVVTSLRQRSETTDLTADFGTTDIALILERITCSLQRLQALEDDILRDAAGIAADPQPNPMAAAASPRIPSAPRPAGLKPATAPLPAPEPIVAAPVRATGPPRPMTLSAKLQRGPSILSHREAWQAPLCRFHSPAARCASTDTSGRKYRAVRPTSRHAHARPLVMLARVASTRDCLSWHQQGRGLSAGSSHHAWPRRGKRVPLFPVSF
jgi:hypothetical protein